MIRTTLITDGSSDQVLNYVIEWALWEAGVRADAITQWADFSRMRVKPNGLNESITLGLELFPCDLLFVHRDAEAMEAEVRETEILDAVGALEWPPHVPIIPIRMQESWLLCDKQAIKTAAGNPNSQVKFNLPQRKLIEEIADPKELVFRLLKMASGRRGRKLKQFNVEAARTRIAQHVQDLTCLRELSGFVAFEERLRAVVDENHFDTWR